MTIRRGARGVRVREIQEQLNRLGFGPLREDGIFGALTYQAVINLQMSRGLLCDGVVGIMTRRALIGELEPVTETPEPPEVVQAMYRAGYRVHEDGQVNIIGVRSDAVEAGAFDDEIHIAWLEAGEWQRRWGPATTDPGVFWLEHPMRVEGCAIMVPGQYCDAYGWGLHRGQYRTLVQTGEVRVYRDADKDTILDMDASTIVPGYGLNLHHAGHASTVVGKWSAGCQVWAIEDDWGLAMAIADATGKTRFDYTLLTQKDLEV